MDLKKRKDEFIKRFQIEFPSFDNEITKKCSNYLKSLKNEDHLEFLSQENIHVISILLNLKQTLESILMENKNCKDDPNDDYFDHQKFSGPEELKFNIERNFTFGNEKIQLIYSANDKENTKLIYWNDNEKLLKIEKFGMENGKIKIYGQDIIISKTLNFYIDINENGFCHTKNLINIICLFSSKKLLKYLIQDIDLFIKNNIFTQ